VCEGIIYGLLGALLVMIIKERDAMKAVIMGVSAPALIMSALEKAETGGPKDSKDTAPPAFQEQKASNPADAQHPGHTVGLFDLILGTPAYAGEPPPPPPVSANAPAATPDKVKAMPGRYLEIYSNNEESTFSAVFLDKHGQELDRRPVNPERWHSFRVPPTAQALRFAYDGHLTPTSYPLNADPNWVQYFDMSLTAASDYNSLWQYLRKAPGTKVTVDIAEQGVRALVPPATEGWISMGLYVNNAWSAKRYTSYDGPPGDAVGKTATVTNAALYMRKTPGKTADALKFPQSQEPMILSLQQPVQIEEVKPAPYDPTSWWAKVKVLPSPPR
jgi:hypothetical protein